MGILYSLIIGAVVGWLAGEIMKSSGGIVRNIILGIVGSLVGHLLFGIIGIGSSNLIGDLLISTIGACLVIYASRKFSK